MNRKEFMKQLEKNLDCVEKGEREAALRYYEEYFDDADDERAVIEELGSPERLAREIIEQSRACESDDAEYDERHRYCLDEGGFHSVIAELVNANFRMHIGKGYAIDINYPDGAKTPVVEITDGVLTISEEKQIFGINIFKSGAWRQGRIDITVPDVMLYLVKVENVNGRVSIPAISAGEIRAETVNGGVTLEGTTAEESIHASSVNGGVSVTDCCAKKGLHAETVNGAVTVSGELRGKTHAEAVNGAITVSSALGIAEYDINAQTACGSVRVNGKKYHKKYVESHGSPNSIKVEGINGSVTLDLGV